MLGLVFVEHKKRETNVSQRLAFAGFYYLLLRFDTLSFTA
ncbi:hypothetical protein VCRA2120O435_20183 [Vibrio crassostreae]|nr:hypothetical protein VCRA2114O422_20182 [Vibrio crassostreae]CAK1986564.1 hypothetical protein VCRA2119O431_20183 [Vibrio crassostreae]CAK2337321.1 hypothetical protein VCRA2116O425_20182 [Vibrio crassostreae]CAK3304411.1 hypothetical protein VCRA2123O445_20182 [Vibrio crassostreae]CAK3437282.1 hypothetical protein VCRA2127O449_20246 [Vibrio crassostreae]